MSQVTSRPGRPPQPPPAAPRQVVPAPAPGGAASTPGGTSAERRAQAEAAVRTFFEGSPGRLRLVGVGAVLACLVFALLGAAAFQARAGALADASADAAQLIRVQQIATEVVKADSLLTNAFPTPDAESADQVGQFNAALSRASRLVVAAAAADPADGPKLAQVSDALGQYGQYATNARSFNKDGKQVALGYLRQAGAALRGQDTNNPNLITGAGMLPALNDLIKASTDRVDGAYTASNWATVEMIAADLVALAGLVLVQVWLARRTRRYLNLPLVVATAGVLVVLVVGAFVMAGAQSRANDVRATSYTALRSLAEARIAANAAKSDASISFLYLRTGGSFATYKSDYDAKVLQVGQSLQRAGSAAPSDSTTDFVTWRKAADTIFTSDFTTRPDDWIKAANAMAKVDEPFNKPFLALDDALAQKIDAEADKVGTGLDDGRAPIVVLGWVALVVGLLAAVGSWAGIAQRLEDYR